MFLLIKRAANETRTRDPDLGKVVLYQLSYCRILLRDVYAVAINQRTLAFCFAGAKVILF